MGKTQTGINTRDQIIWNCRDGHGFCNWTLFTAFALAGTAHSGGVLLLLIPAAIFLNFVPTEKAAAPNACANRKPKRSPEFSCYSGGVVWHPLSISFKL